MKKSPSGVLAALVVALSLVAGCSGDPANPAPGAGSSSAGGAPSAPASDPPGAPEPGIPQPGVPQSGLPKPSGTDPAGPVPVGTRTLSGTVSAGVEANCLLLADGSTTYLLIVDDPAAQAVAKVGAAVTVVGRAQPDLVTTCQQGTPFVVTDVRPK